jgi:hypothetical protein
MDDFVCAKNPEPLRVMGKTLGYDRVIAVSSEQRQEANAAILIDSRRFKQYPQGSTLIYKSDEHFRETIERYHQLFVHDVELIFPRDGLHTRYSGLNHITCEIMHEKGHSYLLNLQLLSSFNGNKQSFILGRMRQNAQLCKKYHVPISFASFAQNPFQMRSAHDMETFLRFLTQ